MWVKGQKNGIVNLDSVSVIAVAKKKIGSRDTGDYHLRAWLTSSEKDSFVIYESKDRGKLFAIISHIYECIERGDVVLDINDFAKSLKNR